MKEAGWASEAYQYEGLKSTVTTKANSKDDSTRPDREDDRRLQRTRLPAVSGLSGRGDPVAGGAGQGGRVLQDLGVRPAAGRSRRPASAGS